MYGNNRSSADYNFTLKVRQSVLNTATFKDRTIEVVRDIRQNLRQKSSSSHHISKEDSSIFLASQNAVAHITAVKLSYR